MLAIIDYGVGNLFSLSRSLDYLGVECRITRSLAELKAADRILLPGVGAFGDARQKLAELSLIEPIQELAAAGKPFLGICLGMQLLFDSSEEFGTHAGLGLIPGRIVSMQSAFEEAKLNLKVPQIGWNRLTVRKESPLVSGLGNKTLSTMSTVILLLIAKSMSWQTVTMVWRFPVSCKKTMSSALSFTQKKAGLSG